MAKYSKRYQERSQIGSHSPHIYLRGNEWRYIRGKLGGLNGMASDLCQKLNNAAPKRGLKA